MKSTVDDAEWIWDRNKFVNRTYLMKEMFQNYYDGDEDWDLPEVCETLIERLSMTFTTDGKRQRLPLTFYSFIVIIK